MDTIYKKSWLKVVMALFVGLLALVLVACGDTAPSAQKLVDDAKDALKIVYGGTEDATKVTRNVTLTTKVTSELGDITVNWVSSHENIIEVSGQTGKVTRPDADTTVTLTATLTLDGKTATKPFELKVLAAETSPSDALAALNIAGATFNEGTGRYTVAGNLTLPTTSEGLAVTWSSTPEGIISSTGEVTRPAWNASDALVQLTATIGGEERTFVMIVLKVTEKPVSAKLQDAADVLLIPGTTDGVTVDLTLAATAGQEGVTVTWQSSNTDILGHDGKLSYPDEVTTVVMTATLAYPGSSETLTKEFSLTVLASVEATEYASIKALQDAGMGDALGKDAYVMIPGVTIVALTKDGLIIADETGLQFVFMGSAPNSNDYVVGEVIDIYGAYNIRFGTPQLTSVVGGKPIRYNESNAEPTILTPTVVTDINAYVNGLLDGVNETGNEYDSNNIFQFEYLQITTVVRVQGTGNYDTVLVNPDYNGANIDTLDKAPNAEIIKNALMIYYKSNIEDVRLFDGLVVTMKVFLNSLRTDKKLYTVVFTGVADDVVAEATNEEMVNIVGAAIQNGINKEYVAAATLNLPKTMLGATITYTSDNALINIETGAVTMPESGQVTVTLTAKVVRDGLEKEFKSIVTLGELPLNDIKDALSSFEKGSNTKVKGTLSAIAGLNYYVIEDETGSVAIYTADNDYVSPFKPVGNYTDAIQAFWLQYYGKEIEIEGVYNEFKGLRYIVPMKIKVINPEGATYPATDINDVALTSEALAPYQSQKVLISNLEIKEIPTQSYGNILFVLTNGTNDMDLFWDARTLLVGGNTVETITSYLSQFKVGDKVDIVGATLGQKNESTMRFVLNSVTNVIEHLVEPTTDEGKTDSASEALDIPAETRTSLIILPKTGKWGTTITWVSNNESIINSNTGVVTIPEESSVEVTLTATIKSGEFTKNYDFVVTVLVAEDLMIYEVYGGGGNTGSPYLNDFVVLYNNTDKSINLDGYSLQYASATGTFNEGLRVNLSGSIAANGYFVLKYAGGANGVHLPMVIDFVVAEGSAGYIPNLAGSNGKIALVRGTALITGPEDSSVIDYVAFGTGLPALGSGAAPAPSNTTSIKRKSFDNTKDNANDFVASAIDVSYLPVASKVTVTFVANGGTPVPENVVVVINNTISEPTLTLDEKVIEGWYLNEEFSGDKWDFLDVVSENITLYAKWVTVEAPPEGVHHETFDSSTLTTAYGDATFTGVIGVQWTVTHSRNEDIYDIDGKGIMLRRPSDSTVKAVIQGGLDSFSLDFKKAFTGNTIRKYKITLTDGTTSYSFDLPEFGLAADNDIVFKFAKEDLGLVGEVTVLISGQGDSSSNAQFTIDNFKWTSFQE